jgi:urease accessory protein
VSARRAGVGIALAAVGVACPPARAHLVSTELGPFYDGAAHTLITPGDLLALTALAVLAALAGRAAGAALLVALTAAWAVGAAAGFGVAALDPALPLLAPVLLLALGLLGALAVRVHAVALAAGGALVGLALGVVNGVAARVEDGVWLTVLGMVTGVFVAASILLGAGVALERMGWAVVLRVAASWIAAIGLLMLGWEIRALVA